MIKTTANKIVIRGNLVSKPSNDNAFPTSVCANRITARHAIDNRRKSRAKVEVVHNQKVILCASKDGTFVRENCFVTPLDGLNGRDASRLRAPWLHYTGVYRTSPVRLRVKNPRGERLPWEPVGLKNSTSKRTNYNLSSLSFLLSSCFHRNQIQNQT